MRKKVYRDVDGLTSDSVYTAHTHLHVVIFKYIRELPPPLPKLMIDSVNMIPSQLAFYLFIYFLEIYTCISTII